MKIAVLGRTSLLYKTMQLLTDNGHQIVLIGTCKAALEYDTKESDFEEYAKANCIPFFCNANLQEDSVAIMLEEAHADIAVSVNWINIIEEESIKLFKYGILNAHAGDLPRYRGNACPNWAIILGEERIAVSIHFMEPGMLDSGDILLKKFFTISRETRIGEVYQWMDNEIPYMFVEAISGLATETLLPERQSKDTSTWLRVYPRIPADSMIDWAQTRDTIERLVNASSEPFSGAYTYYRLQKLIVWRVHTEPWGSPSVAVPGQVVKRNFTSGEVAIACSDGVIWLEDVSLEGNRVRPYAVIKSMRDRMGMYAEDELYWLSHKLARLERLISQE